MTASMTKKHFDALAAALKFIQPSGSSPRTEFHAGQMDKWGDATEVVAGVCARFNPNFDRARFLKACGVEVS